MRVRRPTRLLQLIPALLVTAGAPAPAEVIWRGDFESGDIKQWSKAQVVAPDRLQVVTSPVRQGQHALRVEVRQGDDPINASGNRAELVWMQPEVEGNERYYAWSTMWPSSYPSKDTWQLFTQWHHSGNTGSPPVEFFVRGETVHFSVQGDIYSMPLVRGVWRDFIFHVRWSASTNKGFVELWVDGKLVVPKRPAAGLFPGMSNYLKQGLYRNDTIAEVGVVYHDGMVVGTTLADVLPPLPPAGPRPDVEPGPAVAADAGIGSLEGWRLEDGAGSGPDADAGSDTRSRRPRDGCAVCPSRAAPGPDLVVIGLALALATWCGRRGSRSRCTGPACRR